MSGHGLLIPMSTPEFEGLALSSTEATANWVLILSRDLRVSFYSHRLALTGLLLLLLDTSIVAKLIPVAAAGRYPDHLKAHHHFVAGQTLGGVAANDLRRSTEIDRAIKFGFPP